MRLVWRDVEIAPGKSPIFTSLTERETTELQRLAPARRVLEIGTAFGYGTVVMGLAGAEDVWSIDPHVTHDSLQACCSNIEQFGLRGRVKVCVGTSRDFAAKTYSGPHIGAGPSVPHRYFGMVFIDGDHTAEGVRHDLLWARQLVKPFGAVIACHDYDEDTCPGVKQAIDAMTAEWRAPSYIIDTLAVYSDPRG